MHAFTGKWITNEDFADVLPRDRFYQHSRTMLAKMAEKDRQHNEHILFRKTVTLRGVKKATIFISADDYYKLYINGAFVAMGPAPSYKWAYAYNEIDVTKFLKPGRNVIAVHTYYQGLINRYWVSGDLNHGLIFDLVADGKTIAKSDTTCLTATHTGYQISGTYGYSTCYREDYDTSVPETGFQDPDFDDSIWKPARFKKYADYAVIPQKTKRMTLREVKPVEYRVTELPAENAASAGRSGKAAPKTLIFADFGAIRVGYVNLTVRGPKGAKIALKSAQELTEDGRAMYELRTTNVEYLEYWTIGEGVNTLDQFDYKPMRYLEIELPAGVTVESLSFTVRHYPFTLRAAIRPELMKAAKTEEERKNLEAVWRLAADTLKYGPQDTIHDCMDRERGTYLADVGLAAATQAVLTKDVSLLRGLIEDAFQQIPIMDSLGAGTCCSLIHHTAEYPLIFLRLLWFCYCVSRDKKTLKRDYERMTAVLDAYRRDYEKDGLIAEIDKWCVVEWPKEYRDGYDADLSAKNAIEPDTHVVLNLHYYKAVCMANRIARELGLPAYRDEKELGNGLIKAFYDRRKHLFRDRVGSTHTSYIGNLYEMAFGLIPDEYFEKKMAAEMQKKKVSAVNEFGPFPILEYYAKRGDWETVKNMILDPGAWLNMIREGATATWEAWGKTLKWNTSLFHNSLAYVALFMADGDAAELFS